MTLEIDVVCLFPAMVETPLQSLGRFALRGFSAPVGVYGIAS